VLEVVQLSGGGQALSDYIKALRNQRDWTQDQLADNAGVSIDSVRRLEAGDYVLPVRASKSGGHAVAQILRAFGIDVCNALVRCYSEDEIRSSYYRKCLGGGPQSTRPVEADMPNFRSYVANLPQGRDALLVHGALFNAHAMAFVIEIEKEFDRFEFLITNQPPFMLFADNEYVTTGSASVELPEHDRNIYHNLIFDHQDSLHQKVARGEKHYRVVLHKQSLIDFLGARSKDRSTKVISRMVATLRYHSFNLVVLEAREPLDEFEVLSARYPFDDKAGVSIQHRRVGIHNTLVYQPAIIGARPELVSQDHARAESLWNRATQQYEEYPAEYSRYKIDQFTLREKRITAKILQDALQTAHGL
jgi:transcriptional regulator with XRE-family HTH domain